MYVKFRRRLFIPFLLSCVIFMWPIQIPLPFINVEGIPIYVLFFIVSVFIYNIRKIEMFYFLLLIGIFSFITYLQILQGATFNNLIKSVLSFVVFSFIVVRGAIFLKLILSSEYLQKKFFKYINLFMIIQVLLQIVEFIASVSGYYYCQYKYIGRMFRVSGLFNEPSHLAISLMPFLYLFLIHFKFARQMLEIRFLFLLLISFLLSPSTTLLVIVTLLFLLKLIHLLIKKDEKIFHKFILFFIVFWVIIILTYIFIKVPFVQDRIQGVAMFFDKKKYLQITNLSALLFLKGYEMAKASLIHFPWGVGFLNLSYLNNYTMISNINDICKTFNANDGTSLAFKIIGEYSYIGLSVVLFSVIYFLLNFYKKNQELKMLCVFGLLCTYVRGASYFDGFPMLSFMIFYLLFIMFFHRFMRKYVFYRKRGYNDSC